jgi:hypothetical protein
MKMAFCNGLGILFTEAEDEVDKFLPHLSWRIFYVPQWWIRAFVECEIAYPIHVWNRPFH